MKRVSALLAAMLLTGSAAVGQSTRAVSFEIGGYLRSITAVQDLGYDTPLADRRSVFNGEVLRFKWLLGLDDRIRVAVHSRLQLQVSSTTQSLGTGVTGLGVSAMPERTIDLETTLLDDDQLRVWHDLDRLAVSVYTGAVDVTVGRQGVSWGISNLFPVADLWAQLSPFELDTEERRGIDAVRALAYPGRGIELDVVVADRGRLRDVSAGARTTLTLPWGDVYVAGGKFWRRLIALAGVAAVRGSWKLRGEVAVPWEMDAGEFEAVRATIGADRLGSTYLISLEYHLNGLGTRDAAGYVDRLRSPEIARGETYFVGRHYVGGLASYSPNDRLTLTTSVLINPQDPSTAISPALTNDFGQSVRVAVGALLTAGEVPNLGPSNPQLRSEFGTYGRLLYTTVSVYF